MMAGRAAGLNIRTINGKTEIGMAIHSKDTIYILEKLRDEELYSQKKKSVSKVIVKTTNYAEPSK